ncbi:MAG: hypothetical protein LBS00_02665, partial [Synergistaceae bacterium]|nr:hypothetical protein [Synergistaceae bacterium]
MSKKDKKKPQQNLSLKERLEKHWNNRNWAAFVSLFLRDRGASMRTPWASRWDDALYNCLTNALFVEKDLKSVAMALELVREERGISGVSPLLCDCADVASDFLNIYQSGVVSKPSPLLAEAGLPSSYSALRGELVSLAATKTKKSPQNEAENLVKKLATQHAKLERAKTAIPYATWMKIAKELQDSTSDIECSNVFQAVHSIVTLVHKLVLTGKGENALRDAGSLLADPVFRHIPQNQTHPAVRTLWEFFCQTGERKYGKDWGGIARVLQLSFMKPLHPDLEQLKSQYDRLTKMKKNEFLDEVLQSALLVDTSRWTDQENYILRMFFVLSFRETDFGESKPFELVRFLESFKILGEIGRKWRPEAPWTNKIRSCFEDTILNLPRKFFPTLSQWNLPYEVMTPTTLLYFALIDPYNSVVKEAVTLPLTLSQSEMQS